MVVKLKCQVGWFLTCCLIFLVGDKIRLKLMMVYKSSWGHSTHERWMSPEESDSNSPNRNEILFG